MSVHTNELTREHNGSSNVPLTLELGVVRCRKCQIVWPSHVPFHLMSHVTHREATMASATSSRIEVMRDVIACRSCSLYVLFTRLDAAFLYSCPKQSTTKEKTNGLASLNLAQQFN